MPHKILKGLFFLLPALLVFSCELKPEKAPHRLARRVVFEVEEKKPDSVVKKPVFADTSYIEYVFTNYDLVDIKSLDSGIVVDLRYASLNNFVGHNIYDGLRKAYFTCETALMVAAAQYYLKKIDTSLTLVILDATRPHHVQQTMWDSLQMPSAQKINYLAPPEETSLHNYGCAVDATIMDLRTGELLDMGTEYDAFEKLSQPALEHKLLKSGKLSARAYRNRRMLRYVMTSAGLKSITTEWWHFSQCSRAEAMERYPLIH